MHCLKQNNPILISSIHGNIHNHNFQSHKTDYYPHRTQLKMTSGPVMEDYKTNNIPENSYTFIPRANHNNNNNNSTISDKQNRDPLDNWDPAETKTFDVYSVNDATKRIPFLDVFAEEFHPKLLVKQEEFSNPNNNNANFQRSIHSNLSALDNSTNVAKPPSQITPKIEITKHVSDQTSSNIYDQLPLARNPNSSIDEENKDPETPSLSNIDRSEGPHNLLPRDTTDKWSSEVEDAFLDALRLIPKKGTSKIKLSDKNYGRNELISLYIYYHTKEFRTKKQISSHIQVWKKAIYGKKKSNLTITASELELLELIENGSPKNNDHSSDGFNRQFRQIIDTLEKEASTDKSHQLRETFPILGNNVKRRTSSTDNGSYDSYNSLITPTSAGGYNANTGSRDSFSKNVSTMMYPMEYAKDMYELLPEYKCLPVNIRNKSVYLPFPKERLSGARINKSEGDIFKRRPMSRAEVIDRAAEVERRQRLLIDTVGKALHSPQDTAENLAALNGSTPTLNTTTGNTNTNTSANIINNINNSNNPTYYRNNTESMMSAPITQYNNASYAYNTTSNNQVPATNNLHIPGNLPYHPDYTHSSQWNSTPQYAMVSSLQHQHQQTHLDRISSNVNDFSNQSQSSNQMNPEVQQGQPSQTLYNMAPQNRMNNDFTPAELTFPNSYPPVSWFSPNNQQPIPYPPSQYNYGPSQYPPVSGALDGQRSQQNQQQPQPQQGTHQAPYYPYQPHMYGSSGSSNTSPAYPTFGLQSMNKHSG